MQAVGGHLGGGTFRGGGWGRIFDYISGRY